MVVKRLTIGAFLLAALAAGWSACTMRYDFTECQNDGDCRSFEEPAAGDFLRCGSDNQCVVASGIECREDAHCASGRSCESNRCVGGSSDAGDAGGDAGVDADAGTSCETTKECIEQFEEGYVCAPGGKCVDATTQLCPNLKYPNEQRNDVVILGSIIPASGPFENVGGTLTNAIQMAVGEYFDSARSLPSGQKIAWLQCDTTGDNEAALKAARHLVRVGAPAIIGPLRSGNYLDVVDQVTADAGVTTIAPAATSPAISNLEAAGDLSFRIIGNDRFQARAILDRLETLLEGDSDPKVTVFYKKDQYGQDLESELLDLVLEANWIDRSNFAFLPTVNPAAVNYQQDKIRMDFADKVTAALNSKQPGADVVVFVGTSEAIDLAATYIKTAFGSGSAQTDPLEKRYLFSHGAVSDVTGFADALGGNQKYLPLSEGISPAVIDRENFPPFNSRYNAQFGEKLSASAAGISYDAANLAMLAMAAVPSSDEITGEAVGKVIASGKLQDSDGIEIAFGDSGFQGTATQKLREGKSVDLQGVSGDLDLNDKGDVRSNYIGIDIGMKRDLNGNLLYDIVPTRLYGLAPAPSTAGSWGPIPPGVQTPGVGKSATPNKPIPDDDTSGLSSSQTIQGCGTVNVAHVSINAEHPAPEELRVELNSPAATQPVVLREGSSGTVAPLVGTFPTTLLPDSDYSKILAGDGNGEWTLTVSDTSAQNGGGKLKAWGLTLYCGQ